MEFCNGLLCEKFYITLNDGEFFYIQKAGEFIFGKNTVIIYDDEKKNNIFIQYVPNKFQIFYDGGKMIECDSYKIITKKKQGKFSLSLDISSNESTSTFMEEPSSTSSQWVDKVFYLSYKKNQTVGDPCPIIGNLDFLKKYSYFKILNSNSGCILEVKKIGTDKFKINEEIICSDYNLYIVSKDDQIVLTLDIFI
jgi:hypothetical protein